MKNASGQTANEETAALLAHVDTLPGYTLIQPKLAAKLLGTAKGTLANWRSKRVGPEFVRQGDFVRYELRALRAWIDERRQSTSSDTRAA